MWTALLFLTSHLITVIFISLQHFIIFQHELWPWNWWGQAELCIIDSESNFHPCLHEVMCASTTRTYLYVGNYKITTNIELQELNLSGNFIGDNEIVEREWVTWVFEFLVKFYSSTKFVLKSMYGMNLRIMISLNWISVTNFSVRSFELWVVFANEDKENNSSLSLEKLLQ